MTAALTTVARVGQAVPMGEVPDPQVPEKAIRRSYTAKYKRDILAEYEACDKEGKGALLRREGLYTSLITAWRHQRDKAVMEALARPAGAPPASPEQKENAHLRKQVARLTAELETARKVIEIQSKLSALLDQISTGSSNNNDRSTSNNLRSTVVICSNNDLSIGVICKDNNHNTSNSSVLCHKWNKDQHRKCNNVRHRRCSIQRLQAVVDLATELVVAVADSPAAAGSVAARAPTCRAMRMC